MRLILILGVLSIFLTQCDKVDNEVKGNGSRLSLDSAVAKYEEFLYKDGIPGGTVRFPIYKEPTSFNPFVEPFNVPFMYDGLMILSGNKLIKGLAHDVWVSEDSLVWKFKLHENLLWSDSTELTSDDVFFTYNDVLKKIGTSQYYGALLGRDSEKAFTLKRDGDSITFSLNENLLNKKTLFTLPVLPQDRYKKYTDNDFSEALSVNVSIDSMVGSGPFILADYAPFGRLVFVKNEHYYRSDYKGQKLPYLDTLEFVMLSDLDEALEAFKDKKLDFLAADGKDYNQLKKSSRYQLFKQQFSHNGNMLLFNNSSEIFKCLDMKGLQLLSVLIPKSSLIDSLLDGYGQYDSPLQLWSNQIKDIDGGTEKDLAGLLNEKGFHKKTDGQFIDKNGKTLNCNILVSSSNGFRVQMTNMIAEKLKTFGINALIEKCSIEEFTDRIEKKEYDAVVTAYDEGASLKDALHFWSDYAFSSITKEKLIALVQKIESVGADDSTFVNKLSDEVCNSVPAIFLVRSSRNIFVSRSIGNVNPSPYGGYTGDISRLFKRL